MNNRIKELREAMGISMREFAKNIEISHTTISMMEAGQRTVTPKMIKAICYVYPNVNKEWLETGEGEMFLSRTPMDEIMERLATIKMTIKNNDDKHAVQIAKFKERLATAILNLNDEGCDLVIKFIEDMGYVKKEEND